MADFITQHCGPDLNIVDLASWTLFFDGSSCGIGSGIGIVLVSPRGQLLSSRFRLRLLLLTIKLSIGLFLRESSCSERLRPMQWKYLETLC